ncbi:MAG: hypothetical protein KDA85_14860, partial [Planctomycetaceae bacterium]|nr:hypothetical protein [Planctomycetaceae bacterium]
MRFRSKGPATGTRLAKEQKRLILVILGIGVTMFVGKILFFSEAVTAPPNEQATARASQGTARHRLADDEFLLGDTSEDRRSEAT